MTASVLLETHCLERAYGSKRALHPTDLRLAGGEVAALLGPNGAGKSTLCSLLALLLRPSGGEVRFAGERARPHHRGLIGLCAHASLCYADLSARENLQFFAELHGVARSTERIDALIDRMGLGTAQHRAVRTFSRGMLQRLALARAILHEPDYLLLDEPFTGLDRAGVATLVDLIREERARGRAILIVTHDLHTVAGLASRAVILRRGATVYDGPAPTSGPELHALYQTHVEGAPSALQAS